MKKLLLSTVALAAMTMAASADIALRVTQDAGQVGEITQDFFGAVGQTSFTNSGPGGAGTQFGDFLISNISGSTVGSLIPPTVLTTNMINIQNTSGTAHTLDVWFTGNGLTSPSGIQDLKNSFTVVELTAGWNTTLQTLYSAANLNFTGTEIAHADFAGQGTTGQSASVNVPGFNLGAGPYSLTAHYSIETNGFGNSNTAISIAAVPGPIVGAGLPGLLGMLGIGGWSWKRRKQKLAAAA